MKPILFNTEMVRAILDGRKTVTRRVVKPQPIQKICYHKATDKWLYCNGMEAGDECKPPYYLGDILYVRETWKQAVCDPAGGGYALTDLYLYKADEPIDTTGMLVEDKWCPSIHMTREAARIFLRVKNVRVERLQDITGEEIVKEGLSREPLDEAGEDFFKGMFYDLWDSTIPKHPNKFKRYPYYWNDNPWVWVIEFERIGREEAYDV